MRVRTPQTYPVSTGRTVTHSPGPWASVLNTVTYSIAQAGCAVDREFIKVEHCDAQVGGGFRPPDGVVVCHNHLASQIEVGAGAIADAALVPGSLSGLVGLHVGRWAGCA